MLTKEQLEFRKTGIGGSDASAVLGISRYKTPLDVYLEKVGEREDTIVNRNMDVGNKVEPYLIKKYSMETGFKVNPGPQSYRNPINKFMIGNLDGIVPSEKSILECKSASSHLTHLWGKPGSDEMPNEYLIQCAHYAATFDLDKVDLAVSFLDEAFKNLILETDMEEVINFLISYDFRIYTYRRNKDLEKKMVEKERDLWMNHVEKKTPPLASSYADASRMWPKAKTKTKVVDEASREAINQIRELKKLFKNLENEESVYKSTICNLLEDASHLIDVDGTNLASWKNQSSNRFDLPSFKEKYPDLYREFCKDTETRVLRIS